MLTHVDPLAPPSHEVSWQQLVPQNWKTLVVQMPLTCDSSIGKRCSQTRPHAFLRKIISGSTTTKSEEFHPTSAAIWPYYCKTQKPNRVQCHTGGNPGRVSRCKFKKKHDSQIPFSKEKLKNPSILQDLFGKSIHLFSQGFDVFVSLFRQQIMWISVIETLPWATSISIGSSEDASPLMSLRCISPPINFPLKRH